jgi:hypothetical protein
MKARSKLLSFLVLVMLVAAGATAVTSGSEPDGTFVQNGYQNAQGSLVRVYSAQLTQNGQFVSGQDNAYNMDQTTYPGSRADAVQSVLASEGRDRNK